MQYFYQFQLGGRREIRGRYPIPATTLTRTPKVDEIFTSSESRFPKNTEAKAIEKDLSHISTCTLDAARPLLDLIEGVNSGEFTLEDVKVKAVNTLRLLGNVVAIHVHVPLPSGGNAS